MGEMTRLELRQSPGEEGGARSHLTGQVDRTGWLICCEGEEEGAQDDSSWGSTSESKRMSTGGGLRKKVRELLNLRCLKVIQTELKYILGVQGEVRIQSDIS